jgi:hypothetical protein
MSFWPDGDKKGPGEELCVVERIFKGVKKPG